MKRLLPLLSMLLLFIACDNSTYKITGTITSGGQAYESFDGQTVYLDVLKNETDKPVDSTTVTKNTFTLTVKKSDAPDYGVIFIKGQRQPITVFLENPESKNINVVIDVTQQGLNAEINGTPLNDLYTAYSAGKKPYLDRFNELMQTAQTQERTPELEQEIKAKHGEILEDMLGYSNDFLNKNPGTFVSAIVLTDAMNMGISAEDAQKAYDQLPDYIKNTEVGTGIKSNIRKQQIKPLEVGEMFRNLTMKTPEGNDMSLSDYAGKGKYVLVDFWASWCGPCRRENPHVVKLYDEYKDKGFEIVGVSLDQDKDKWIAGIKADSLTWPQMSDIKGWDSEASVEYKIEGIPFTVLLDKEGKVIETNLRGDALTAKLKELMP